MVIDKSTVQHDSYVGDSGKEKVKFLGPKGFRFTGNRDERM